MSSTDSVVDGVRRLSPTGISILVVGGGVGGMMTALESWRQGHDVRILERNPKLDTIGTYLPPNLDIYDLCANAPGHKATA